MSLRPWLAKVMTFDGWMAIAEIIDALRVFPRFVLLFVLFFVAYDLTHLMWFFFNLPSEDKSSAGVVTFVSVVTGVHTLLLTKTIELYNGSARDWAAYHNEKRGLQTTSQQTVTASTTVSTGASP